jgi:coiled-coil domain-containing protein 55
LAEEKMMQREREAEGDEFADKEAFVTQAYKDQMAEARRADEEERRQEGSSLPSACHFHNSCFTEAAKKKGGGTSTGLAQFYRKYLEDSEQQHEETVAATTSTQSKPTIGPQGPSPNLTITKPPEFTHKSDFELANQARERGLDVELNDDNQIVDKRELLSAGLNLSAPNTRRLGLQKSSTASTSVISEGAEIHRAVGTAASRKEINERRAREIRQQMEEEQARVVKAKELQDYEATQRIVAKRNNEDDLQNARERYLQRKRQKLADADNPDQKITDDPP